MIYYDEAANKIMLAHKESWSYRADEVFKSELWEKADISDQAAKQRKQFFSSIFPFSPGLEELNAVHQHQGKHFSLLNPLLQMPVSLKHTLQTHSGILHLQPSGHRISISYSDSGLWITETKHEK